MMKKLLSIFMVSILSFSMFGCTKSQTQTTPKQATERKSVSDYKKLEFKLKTLDQKEVDSATLFKDKKLTMVNIWATFCGPCIEEMPEIQKLYEDLKKDNVNVIGIVSDTLDNGENNEDAKRILNEKKATFTNLLPSKDFINSFLINISVVPTTIFVDSKGNIVGEPVVGAHAVEEYKEEIQKRLESLK